MGMYTTIIHPDDGRELQIKTGDDDLEVYHVGDEVDFKVNPDWVYSGKLFDGVYRGCGYTGEDAWVVIKNHKVEAVENLSYSINELTKKYDIKELDKSLWTEEAWDRHKKLEEEYKKRQEKIEKEADSRGLTGRERMSFILSFFIRENLKSESLARQILKPVDDKNWLE